MLTRLLRMGIGEVADRGRQEASKWLERNAMLSTLGHAASAPAAAPWSKVARSSSASHEFLAREALDRFRKTGPERFFAGAADPQVPSLLPRLARHSTIASAESIRRRRFDLLGHTALSFGDPVDWRLDPISGRRSPLIHWSSIDPLDLATVGDVKVVWELSRHQFLVTLGVAYQATSDERYAEAFASLVRAWMRDNPPGLGINWASSLEVSLRVISWCWALILFRTTPHLTPELFGDLLQSIDAQAFHIERYLSRHSSPNTHLTGEALGLFYAGVLFPENRSASRWRSLGQGILDREIQRQVLCDGVYFEQATAYQLYTIEIYLHYLVLAGRNHLPVPAEVGAGVQRMLDVLLSMRRPDGGIPPIGDQDGGSLLPLTRREPDDASSAFAVAASLFGRGDFAWAAGGVQPEALWLLGRAGIPPPASKDVAPPAAASRVFPAGGHVVMRSGWERDAHHLVFDVGPLGCPLSGGHGHADLLSVVVSAFGDPFVVDPGTYVYAAEPAFRDHFRGTAAHSTVTVDGRGQADPKGPFGWRDRPVAHLRRFQSTTEFDFADASHDAYERLADPVTHRRRVLFVRSPGYWIVVDDLAGSSEHLVEQRFQFAAMPVAVTTDAWVRARGSKGRSLLIKAFGDQRMATRIDKGSLTPIAGWISPNYGRRIPAPALVFSMTATLPIRILTLLLPVPDEAAAPPRVSGASDATGRTAGLVFGETKATVLFDHDSVSVKGGSTCRV